MSPLDRAIARVAPGWAARRAESRLRMDAAARLGGPSRVRRGPSGIDGWRTDEPESWWRVADRYGRPHTLRERALLRHVLHHNPFAAKALSALLNNLVGYGITATVAGGRPAQKAWIEWERRCDFDRVNDLYGLQDLIARLLLSDGECFIVRKIVTGAPGNPLRLQVLDADMLGGGLAGSHGAIRDGIEYDEDGHPVAYHFVPVRDRMTSPVRVPAENVIHVFRRKHAGQWRGRTHFEAILDAVEDIDGVVEAEVVKRKLQACFVAFRALGPDAEPAATQDDGEGRPPVEELYPGMIINGAPGETMTFGEPKDGGGLSENMRWGGLRVAAGARVTYEHVTGDLSNVNYSSYRAGALEFQRFAGRVQWLTLIPALQRIAAWWIEAGQVAGELSATRPPVVKWTPPPFGSVDPGKDAQADQLLIDMRLKSRSSAAAERGEDFAELVDDIASDEKLLADKGVPAVVKSAPPASKPAPAAGAEDGAAQAATEGQGDDGTETDQG